ncbi:MAG: double-strand break repair protein AddB [Alphaproteobacteria bacterium]|jgi:ATP-dependent helicase/nuclease subunit B|nr:double-strand break repair protein AddB [Alphaproteobacteria bacterium]MBU2041316.1 double-strand break repair protein AddB [Alphaproteobacteria bacterium]MBU2125345.1 double-strand break repair protein AddB [Alphaproteobacteria bacterium]MBU2291021.1 double-strand break repair protein AddB [Alphaproteobacteria bacterium]MBU2396092.1 double-strand break repair protein AddB [Alphaproteobacteria bacterium]
MSIRFDPFLPAGPRWYAIEARRPFLEDLAAGVLDWLGDHPPEALSDAVILLPNRRAARAFTAALSKQAGGRPLLLPQVRPLGDLEEDEPPFAPGELGLDLPPAIAPLTRRFEMARMIVEDFRPGLSPPRALEMADALGGFLDSCQLEEIGDLHRVATLVEGDLAEHWRESAEFLALAVEAWPKRLEALGLVDPAWRRARLLRLLADAWTERPPTQTVIAAGSTGTAPAAADVLAAVAAAPRGCVVLPGLDRALDPTVWATLGENEQHPQNALWRLLDGRAGRDAVRPWFQPAETPVAEARGRARQRLINEALRPADATDDWRTVIADLRNDAFRDQSADPIAQGLEGLSVVTVRAEEDAAAALALMMRETLETPGKTCALVTPDLALGRRVAARLERWGVVADVSSGQPLSRMDAGRLIDLAVRFIDKPLDPHALLGLLKHPLTRLDLGETDVAAALRALEHHALRGPRHRDWSRLRRALLKAGEPRDDGKAPSEGTRARLTAATTLVDRLEALSAAALAPFAPDAPLDAAARALTGLVEALAGQDAWAGPDGETSAGLLSGLIEGGASLGAVSRAEFADLVRALLAETTVRTGGANQPRLRILGAIEARLVRADRMILAGLEEGVWPNAAPTDPFLSRPMRQTLGLPPPERRLGQTAQDFVQAACADEAILVHSERRGGQPAVRSRWLWRLEMLTRGADAPATPIKLARASTALEAARALDVPPPGPPRYARRPAPTPPVHRRPRQLPVTGVERWVRDPYAVYAQRILGLQKLERPGASAEAMARGNAVHRAIERVVVSWPGALPDDCADQIEGFLREELDAAGFEDHAMARETPLARNCAVWLAGWERERRARGATLLIEQTGRMTFGAPFGPFILTAKADRIELDADGAAVIDFKTGSTPSAKQVAQGFAPQLTLTAAILADGGFADAPPTPASELLYVKVTGRKTPGEAVDVGKPGRNQPLTAAELAERELARLVDGVAAFDDEARPYVSWAAPQFMGNFGGNYDHLARVWEWHVVGGEDEAPE